MIVLEILKKSVLKSTKTVFKYNSSNTVLNFFFKS